MKMSLKRFVLAFLILANIFQFATNSILGPQVKFYPPDGNWYPGMDSPLGWKNNMSAVIYPLKFVLVEPLTFLAQDPDPVPPVIFLFFVVYWTVLAVGLYYLLYLLRRLFYRKKSA